MKLLIVLCFLPLFSASPFHLGSGGRFAMDSLIPCLEIIVKDPAAFKAINKIFNNDNICLKNMDEVIEAIKESSELVTATEGDLETLKDHIEGLGSLRGETQVVRKVAAVLRALKPLIEKMSPAVNSSKVCSASSENTFTYLRSLAVVMHQLSYDKQVAPTQEARDMFHDSGNILSGLSAFLRQVKTQSREFQNLCFPNTESTVRGIRALGNLMDSMADMFSTLGNYKAGEQIRKGKYFADNIANQIPLINDLNVGFNDCTVTDLDSADRKSVV